MKKAVSLIAIAVLLLGAMLVSIPRPVTALSTPTPKNVYVDTTRQDGNEDGSEDNPYSDLEEGEAYAQAQPSGGNLYVRSEENGEWQYYGKYRSITAGAGGISMPDLVLYTLLAVLALALILIGWQFQRRSHQLRK